MTKLDELKDDLSYVRGAVQRADHKRGPAAIYLLWAAITVVGFSLVDFFPEAVAIYWAAAGPLGGLVSFWLGWRDARRRGHGDVNVGVRHALHWIGMLVAIGMTVLLALTGRLEWDAVSPAILIIVALGWYLAGVHLDRPLLWLGLLMGLGYVVILFVQVYTWTLLGVLIAVGLIVAALVARRDRGSKA